MRPSVQTWIPFLCVSVLLISDCLAIAPALSCCRRAVLNLNRQLWSNTIAFIVGAWKASMCFANAIPATANLQDNFYIQSLIKEAHLGMDDFLRGASRLWERAEEWAWAYVVLLPPSVNRSLSYWYTGQSGQSWDTVGTCDIFGWTTDIFFFSYLRLLSAYYKKIMYITWVVQSTVLKQESKELL